MLIEEAKKEKDKLISDISFLLSDFEKRTNLVISEFDIVRMQVDLSHFWRVEIKIEL